MEPLEVDGHRSADGHRFLVGILNASDDERLQIIAYNVLNVPGYQPSAEESALLVAARLTAAA
jgi:hypothetical protein